MKFKTKLTTILLCIAMLAGTVSCNSTEKPEEMSEENTASVSTVTETATIEAETASPEELRLAEILENKTQLRFNENGEFRILVLADLHIPGDGIPKATLDNVRTIVEKEKPNLVILVGDNVVASYLHPKTE